MKFNIRYNRIHVESLVPIAGVLSCQESDSPATELINFCSIWTLELHCTVCMLSEGFFGQDFICIKQRNFVFLFGLLKLDDEETVCPKRGRSRCTVKRVAKKTPPAWLDDGTLYRVNPTSSDNEVEIFRSAMVVSGIFLRFSALTRRSFPTIFLHTQLKRQLPQLSASWCHNSPSCCPKNIFFVTYYNNICFTKEFIPSKK